MNTNNDLDTGPVHDSDLKFNGTIDKTLITNIALVLSLSSPRLGPPLHVRLPNFPEWRTPARISSIARYSGSWNLSLIPEAVNAVYRAFPLGVAVWEDDMKLDGKSVVSSLLKYARVLPPASPS